MQTYQPGDIRNFAIVGHASSGKTILSEAMLVAGGVIHRMGSITNGTTVSDYHVSEQQRQISVHASLLHTEWLGKKFNIVDTAGYLDFISEGLGALRVGDFALVVVQVHHGVGVGTDQGWSYATQYRIPKMIVINAMDKEQANFEKVLAQCREHYGERVFPMNWPVNPGPGFDTVLDVMRTEIVTYQKDFSGKFQEVPATGDWAEKVNQLHKQLIEYIAESDDSLLEKFFEKGSLTEDELRAGVHAAIQKQSFIPVFCTSAETNVGVARLMDFIAKYGSSPVDREKVEAVGANGNETQVSLSSPEPVLYVFKTMSEAQFGELSFFRLYSGSVKVGTELYNSDRRITEKIGQIYILNGKNRAPVNSINARAESKYRHKKQTGGAGQFAEVWMRIEPRPRNTGVEFTQTLSGQNVDRVYVPSVEKGVMSACTEGILAGYRVVDLKIDFYDGKMHPVDSNDISFQIAGKEAFKEAFTNARPGLLEPIYNLEIKIPEDALGKVIGDLSSRRGKILGMDTDGSFQVVKAQVPAMELYHYATTVRSLTGGRGIHTEEFSHYEEMPRELEQKVIAESKSRKAAEH